MDDFWVTPLGKHGTLEVWPQTMRGTVSFWCDSCAKELMIFISGGRQPRSQVTFQVIHRGTQLSYTSLDGEPTLGGLLDVIKMALNNTACSMKWMP